MGRHKPYVAGDLVGPNKIEFVKRNETNGQKATFICPYDGKEFEAYTCNVSSGKTKSCGCYTKQLISKNVAKDITGKRYGFLTVLYRVGSTDVGKALWKCKCDCGREIEVNQNNLSTGNTKSCGMVDDCDYAYALSINPEYYNLIGKKFGKLTVINYIIKDHTLLWECECDCEKHNRIFVTGKQLTGNSRTSCGCVKSIGESIIIKLLSDLNIVFEIQKKFDNCINPDTGYYLLFDFYLPEYNCCIEYDGKQHFKAIEFFDGEDGFEQTKIRDAIKDQYCKDNNIKLIRIPYTDKEKLSEEYLINLLFK